MGGWTTHWLRFLHIPCTKKQKPSQSRNERLFYVRLYAILYPLFCMKNMWMESSLEQ